MVSEEKLTRVMDYIRKFSEENGYTPSVREIGKECGIKSTATVHSYLEKLQTKGYLSKAMNKKRSVSLAKSSGVNIPLIGTVTAGQVITLNLWGSASSEVVFTFNLTVAEPEAPGSDNPVLSGNGSQNNPWKNRNRADRHRQ